MKKILFASKDPGSANALFPVIKALRRDKTIKVEVFAAKYSKDIFHSHGISFVDMDDLIIDGQAINRPIINKSIIDKNFSSNPDLIVTGSSAGNCIEKDAIIFGKNNHIPTVSILDFWGNYTLRYSDIWNNAKENNDTLQFLPDHIFIMDYTAKEQMIKEGFPEDILIVTGNPYFDTFKPFEQDGKKDHILFISQPLRVGEKYDKDSLVFNDFMSAITEIRESFTDIDEPPKIDFTKMKIIIRPHPKEDSNDYPKQIEGMNIIIDNTTDIKRLIEECQIIFGKHSMVLFEAAFSNRIVISYQPIKEKFDRLITNQLGLSYYAESKEEMKKILGDVLSGKADIRKKRMISIYNDGKCTERVITCLYQLLSPSF